MTDSAGAPGLTIAQLGAVSPVLARYTEQDLLDRFWKEPGLSSRDRSLVTVAAMITRSQAGELTHHVGTALDNGVTAAEISETVAHLAFYAGWGNATTAAALIAPIFAARGIAAEQLPAAEVELLPLDEAAEARRVASVDQSLGSVFQSLAGNTTDLLFRDLWLRPGLAPRDRSLVTVAALTTAGQTAQIGFHLGKAMDNGLTQQQAAEVIAHLAFYAGWPNAMSAAATARELFGKRESAES